MGGDHGLKVTVPAALDVIKKRSDVRLILVGDSHKIQRYLKSQKASENDNLIVRHASEVVGMDESPGKALRGKKDSSMRVAINLVKEDVARAVVSAGNTGALMATARFVLKTLPGVDRPAIITAFPTVKDDENVMVLDLGANVDSCADHLYQFAVMGSVLVSAVKHIENPRIGLLNIGEEEMKGNDQVKATSQLLKASKVINYVGYIEGDDIFTGKVDVVVCDGFVGNITLKTIEGAAKSFGELVKRAFKSNLYTKLVGLMAIPIFKIIKNKVDPGKHNGASLIGLPGTVIKSHGGADRRAFVSAINVAISEVENNVAERIRDRIEFMLEENHQE